MLSDGSSLLADDELEILVILCMNWEFMEFMCMHEVSLAKSLANQCMGRNMVRMTDLEEGSSATE